MKRMTGLLWGVVLAAAAGAAEPTPSFRAAQPVWPENRETERNLFVAFRAEITPPDAGPVVLRMTGSTLYRVSVNGHFAGHGPARAGHGFYRVDEWDLRPHLKAGKNAVVVEVAGYNACSYYLLDQPSFLQAEIVAGDRVLAATGAEGFSAEIRCDRVQKVQRFSFQRPFIEVWRLPGPPPQPAKCAVLPARPLAPHRVPYPAFEVVRPSAHVAEGGVTVGPVPAKPWKDRSLTDIGPQLGGYPEAELATIPTLELQGVKNASSKPATAAGSFRLGANSFRILDFGTNLSGFLGARLSARTKTRIFFTFDEILSDNDVNCRRLGCANVVLYELEPGTYEVESFEPYTLRYLKLIVLEGDCDISGVYLRELANPEASRATFTAADERYNRIFEAARQTFRQNATDVFMDCPSRERAGWLCDSFFTSRVALDLCGDTSVEQAFFENFLKASSYGPLPDGMLPMCYPSDHLNGNFIPNWAMWFVVQLEEYAARSGDRATVDALKPRVMKLLDYFRKFENSDGLLEKLERWVFVEWSAANKFVQDVNYPSNMLYAGMLDAAARLYDQPDLAQKAAKVRETVRKQSFDGGFFVDNAMRKDGKLEVTRNRTEVCQYFAFFFDVATPATHPKLWATLTKDFGPQRKETKAHPEIHPANAFIGNQLRFELLSRDGRSRQILDEAIGYWLYMADRTGTLWENDTPSASCNHGFASHAAHVLLRDVLGLRRVDPAGRRLEVCFADLTLGNCKGSVPTSDGPIALEWRKSGDRLLYKLTVPAGWKTDLQNRSGLKLEQLP